MSLPLRPQLQLALDVTCTETALRLATAVQEHVDILEAGTILLLSRGVDAIGRLRAVWCDRPLVADVRIVEAGAIISDLVYSAGADVVTVFGGTSETAIAAVVERAREHHKRVQIEVFEEWPGERLRGWRRLGIDELVMHRSRDAERTATHGWSAADRTKIAAAAEMGFTVYVTGGVSSEDLSAFAGLPVGGFIVGRAITARPDPVAAAAAFQRAIDRTFAR